MRRARWPAAVVVVVLIAAACSRDSSDTPASTPETPESSAEGTATGDFGTLENVCQEGDASGATAQGVTNNEIRVATFADPGFAGRPGLNQEFFDSAQTFAAWCNAAGGINGRKIVVDERDSALFDYQARIAEACAEDFFMVGGGAVFDDAGVEDRLSCLLPDIAGFAVTPEARGADLVVQPVPNSNEVLAIGTFNWLGEEFPESLDHIGVLTGNLPTTISQARQQQEAVEALGWTVVYDDQYPAAGPTTWAPYAAALKEKGVKGLIWVGEPENLAKLSQALRDAEYPLEWVRADANHYDEKLIDVGGDAVENVFIHSNFYPFEEADDNPATQQYLDAFAQYSPEGKDRAYLGLQGWSAWLLFAQAARDCGSDLTRSCVYDNAKQVHDWTGGGLHISGDPGTNTPGDCYTIVQATPGGFTRPDIHPDDGIFRCGDENLYEFQGDYGTGATLADVGLTQGDLE